VDETVGTNIPKNFVPSVEKGFRAFCEKGMMAGCKVAGVKFRLIDGDHHVVDSNDWAFQCAAQGAMKQSKYSIIIFSPVRKPGSIPKPYCIIRTSAKYKLSKRRSFPAFSIPISACSLAYIWSIIQNRSYHDTK
jgi:hypothetical protein